MVWRNTWKSGDWLVQDEESGLVRYASQTRHDWKGLVVSKPFADYEQPQDFVRPGDDPTPVTYNSRVPDVLTVSTSTPLTIGRTGVPMPRNNAAFHLFALDD